MQHLQRCNAGGEQPDWQEAWRAVLEDQELIAGFLELSKDNTKLSAFQRKAVLRSLLLKCFNSKSSDVIAIVRLKETTRGSKGRETNIQEVMFKGLERLPIWKVLNLLGICHRKTRLIRPAA